MNRILWHSNGPFVASGYGVQTALMVPKLAEHYEIAISCNYGLEGAVLAWQGIPLLPGLGQDHGNESIPGHVDRYFDGPREGLLLTLYDVGPFDPKMMSHYNVACWTPVDHAPATPHQVAFFRESNAIPLAMSHYAEEELAEFEPIYVPHGVDTEVYKPTPSDFRKHIDAEDAFLVGVVAANKGRPSRKCFQEAFEAVRELSRRHDDVKLYVHTVASPVWGSGEDILGLLASLELNASMPKQYDLIYDPMSARRMAGVYSAFDVLLNPSKGEGFGVPIMEAAACGTPSIVSDFSAMPEVAGPSPWKVPGHPDWTGQASWMQRPSVPALVEALEAAYALNSGKRRRLSEKCRKHAEQYDAQKVFDEHMLPAIHEVEERLGDRKPVRVAAAA